MKDQVFSIPRTLRSVLRYLAAGVLAFALVPAEASAQPTISVNDLTDPGSACSMSSCSLRGAIKLANTNMPNSATIIQLVKGKYILTLPGAKEDMSVTGDLDVRARITINGAGKGETVIYASTLDRVFEVHPQASLTITSLTIRDGSVDDIGGGIRNQGSLLLVDSEVIYNKVTGVGGEGGGGIGNEGSATLIRADIKGNSSATSGGAVFNFGYGVLNAIDSAFDLNDAGTFGVALANRGKALFERCTISRNFAGTRFPGRGGGVHHELGGLAFTNSTISGNFASAAGGAIEASGDFSMLYTTVAFNTRAGSLSPALYVNSGVATLQNSIIAEISDGEIRDGKIGDGVTCKVRLGGISSLGYNLETGSSCLVLGVVGDKHSSSKNLRLGPLQNNGGFTETHLPGYKSDAIDHIPAVRRFPDPSELPCLGCPVSTDQRGVRRPETVFSRASDVGAVESLGPFREGPFREF